jgi:hypothetical protein
VVHEVAVHEQQRGHEQDQERQPAREVIHLRHERRGELLDAFEQAADAADLGGLSRWPPPARARCPA